MRKYLIITLGLIIIAVLSSCISGATSQTSSTSSQISTVTSTTTSTPGPTIVITSPSSGNQFAIGKTTVAVQVSNFNLVSKLGQPNSTGEGHIHYFMDVDPPTAQGQPAVTDPGTYAVTANTSYTWFNVGSGQHKFSVELVNNDHTPLNPPVTDSASILVIPEIGPPSAVILSPRDGAVIRGNSVTIQAQATNFNLVDKLGQPIVDREGHLHYFMDVEAPTVMGQPAVTAQGTYAATPSPSYTWPDVLPGIHEFSIELANNDHTPLSPPIVSKITVTVIGPSSPTPTSTPASGGQPVTINLTVQDMAFDQNDLGAPVGANVTLNFTNLDMGIPHNFAIYQNAPFGQRKTIFAGETIIGPAKITYHFTAPSEPGFYYFLDDIHPALMQGSFEVTAK